MRASHVLGSCVAIGAVLTLVASGCGSSRNDSPFAEPDALDSGASEGGSPSFGDKDSGPPCQGLRCQQKACGNGGDTTVSGTVFAPNGQLPIYNAIVYVPNAKPDALPVGATCDKCGAVTGDPVVTALSDATGAFTLKNVPVGKDIPLVIQVGKWRRQVTIPEVKECEETKLTDPELTRLPKNQKEGDMPHIALTTGGCDNLGCMLPKVGIDPSEFGKASDGPSKAVHVYLGSGGKGPSGSANAQTLWSDSAAMMPYDMVILSCECTESLGNKGNVKNAGAFSAMADYLKAGGRIFTTDYMYTWYRYSGDADLRAATNMRGGAPSGDNPMSIDVSFPKGQALKQWFDKVVPGSNGNVQADYVFSNVISNDPALSQQWATSGSPSEPRVFSVNVPVGLPADQQCGKGVHIDAHLNNGSGNDSVTSSYPASCGAKLKPGENLLAFFFFDLASCIQNEAEPPKPPPVK